MVANEILANPSHATILTVDFTGIPDHRQHKSGKQRDRLPGDQRPVTASGKLLTPKQIRARARRKAKRAEIMSDQEREYLYRKPIEDWDLEELARGRPRDRNGGFKGRPPKWVSGAVHEQAMERFTSAVKGGMQVTTIDALRVLTELMNSEEVDHKGKPIVSASTKLDAAKFLIEHVIGKPKQHIQSDVSVKLQGILGQVMANPSQALLSPVQGGEGYTVGHLPGITMAMGSADEDIIDAEWEEYGA